MADIPNALLSLAVRVMSVCRVKHNVPVKEVADASVLVLRANKARATGYVELIQMAQPELYLTLQVQHGVRLVSLLAFNA